MEKETKAPAPEKAEKDLKAMASENAGKEANAILDRDLLRRDDADALFIEMRDAKQDAKSAYSIADMALKTGKVLEGEIAAVEAIDGVAYWVLYKGQLAIRIPFQEAFPDPPEELAGKKPLVTRCTQILSKSLGVTVPFLITSISVEPNGTYIAYGSRVKALGRIRSIYFGPNAPSPVRVGSRVNGTLLSVGRNACYMTVCGCDLKVWNRDLTHRYVEDLTDKYLAGEKVKVEIRDIDTSKERPRLEVSAKPIEMEQFRPNLNRIRVSGRNTTRVMATVTGLRFEHAKSQNARCVVFLFLDSLELPAFASELQLKLNDTLHTGDKVYFEASGVTESGFVHGKITRFIRSR